MRVLVLHTLPPNQTEPERWDWEFDLEDSVECVVSVVPGATVVGVRGEPAEILAAISRVNPDVIFNLCEAPFARPRFEPHAAALFEWLGVPFTGSGSETLLLCRRKDLTKAVLSAAGIPVPGSGRFPCIVKPVDEDGSAEIYSDSICENEAELKQALSRLRARPLVEEFLPGREFVLWLWGRSEPEHVAIAETMFQGSARMHTYTAKWDNTTVEHRNAPVVHDCVLDTYLRASLIDIAQRVWRATGVRGYASIDIRLNDEGCPFVLDVNPNPALNTGVRLYRAVEENGWTWEQFIKRQLEWAF